MYVSIVAVTGVGGKKKKTPTYRQYTQIKRDAREKKKIYDFEQ